jgi:septal ring factor EnvC (AmiA/AmiB activator)
MARTGKGLMVAVVMALGLWGCAQGNSVTSGQAERIRQLEAKVARIEVDYRSAVTSRDQLAKQVTSLEEDAVRLRKTLEMQKNAIKERDALRLEVDARTVERDAFQNRCQHFEDGLSNLLKQYKAMGPVIIPPSAAAPVAATNTGRS